MHTRPAVLIGGGGHACVLADLMKERTILGFVAPDSTSRSGLAYLGTSCEGFRPTEIVLVNAIGGTRAGPLRRSVQEDLEAKGFSFAGVRHDVTAISDHSIISADCQIFPRVIVNVGAEVGVGVILNSGVIVEHHVKIGNYVHVSPGATICGDAVVEDNAHVGAGATIIQGVRVGKFATIGAGAVVISDVPPNQTVKGVPAR